MDQDNGEHLVFPGLTNEGLTKRELFAALMVSRLIDSPFEEHEVWTFEEEAQLAAERACIAADALLAKLEKVQEPGKDTDGTSN